VPIRLSLQVPLYAAQPGVKSHRLCDVGPAQITVEVRRLETNRSKLRRKMEGLLLPLPCLVTTLSDDTSSTAGEILSKFRNYTLIRTIMAWPISNFMLVKRLNKSTS
jgi:hypothetical protein